MASMICFVAASGSSDVTVNGWPTLMVTTGFVWPGTGMRGICELRGHTFSVPHRPTGMTGTPVICARRAAPQRPLQLRVEERRAARDRALGRHADQVAAAQRVGGALERFVRAGAAVDADAAHRLGERADDGHVEHFLLAEEAGVAARRSRSRRLTAVES